MTDLGQAVKKYAIFILVLITLLGAAFRLFDINGKSLWTDEIATIASANGRSIDPDAYERKGQSFDPVTAQPASVYVQKIKPAHGNASVQNTFDVLKDNVHPPFFFGLMHYWIKGTGDTPTGLRIPAIFFGILCIPAVYWLAIESGACTLLALIASALMAFSGYQISHSQDARQYTLLMLLSMTSFGLLINWLKGSSRSTLKLLAITLLSAVGIYSQYFYGLFLVVLYSYGFWQTRSDKQKMVALFLSGAGVVLLFLPWLPYFKAQLSFLSYAGHYSQGMWDPVQLPEKIFRNLNGFVIPSHILGSVIPPVIIGCWLVSAYANQKGKTESSEGHQLLKISLVWIIGVFLLQIILDILQQSQTISIRRYTLITSPAYYLLLAYGLTHIQWKRFRNGLIVIVVFSLLITSGQKLLGKKRSSDDFQSAGAFISEQYKPLDLVIVNRTGASAVGLAFYLNPEIKILGFHARSSDDLREKTFFWCRYKREVDGILPNLETGGVFQQYYSMDQIPQRVWLVKNHAAPSTIEVLSNWLKESGFEENNVQKFSGIHVTLFERKKV